MSNRHAVAQLCHAVYSASHACRHAALRNTTCFRAVHLQCGASGGGTRGLCASGGGTRGLGTIEALRAIEASCGGRPIHQLFDVLCGTSTGGILAVALGVLKRPLDEVASASACHSSSRHSLFASAKPVCSSVVPFTITHLLCFNLSVLLK